MRSYGWAAYFKSRRATSLPRTFVTGTPAPSAMKVWKLSCTLLAVCCFALSRPLRTRIRQNATVVAVVRSTLASSMRTGKIVFMDMPSFSLLLPSDSRFLSTVVRPCVVVSVVVLAKSPNTVVLTTVVIFFCVRMLVNDVGPAVLAVPVVPDVGVKEEENTRTELE